MHWCCVLVLTLVGVCLAQTTTPTPTLSPAPSFNSSGEVIFTIDNFAINQGQSLYLELVRDIQTAKNAEANYFNSSCDYLSLLGCGRNMRLQVEKSVRNEDAVFATVGPSNIYPGTLRLRSPRGVQAGVLVQYDGADLTFGSLNLTGLNAVDFTGNGEAYAVNYIVKTNGQQLQINLYLYDIHGKVCTGGLRTTLSSKPQQFENCMMTINNMQKHCDLTKIGAIVIGYSSKDYEFVDATVAEVSLVKYPYGYYNY